MKRCRRSRGSHYMVSAYKDTQYKQIVLVCINMTPDAVTLPITGLKVKNGRLATYTTTEIKALTKSMAPAGQIQLEPKSVVTLVSSYE